MESSEIPTGPDRPNPRAAEAALTEAETARDRMAGALVLPPYFYSWLGGAIAVQIGTSTAAFGLDGGSGALCLAVGLLVFAAVAVDQLVRFRRLNGVWVAGLASRVVLGTATLTSVLYAVAFAAAAWAALTHRWWLVVLAAAYGGTGYAWCGRRWWESYRGDPAQRRRDDSRAVVLILPVLAAAGLVALLIAR
jgi:hypothetical protein